MNKLYPNRALWVIIPAIGILLLFLAKNALADEDCSDPVGQWQSREVLKKRLEQQAWIVQHIRIDDGCYEVRALDDQGRRVKATYSPAALTLLKLKVKNHQGEHRERDHKEKNDPKH